MSVSMLVVGLGLMGTTHRGLVLVKVDGMCNRIHGQSGGVWVRRLENIS